ncbi:BF3164 family lipoprotein [Cyclobacterium roseum]|uniref:BF3164 family lipoprotein n=1 Tax=Cyclobacterium roseum TaxID=2666137 RepID=UPI001F319817|nr:BF3164 family lipoprotein [Cyclobacterium roseum]
MTLTKNTNQILINVAILIVILLPLTNCSEDKLKSDNLKSFTEKTIPRTMNLVGNKYFFENIKNPLKIFVKNNKLIIGESRRIPEEYPPIHIIDAKNMKYLRPFGKRGFGPGEVSDVSGIDLGGKENTFWVYSAMSKYFSEFTLDDTTTLSKNQIKQEGDLFMAMAMAWSSDSTVMCRLVNDPHQFVEFSIDGRRLANYGKWQDHLVREDLTNYMMSDLHLGRFKGNQQNNIYASAGFYRDRIEILNKESGSIFITDGPFNYIPEFTIVNSSGSSGKLIVDAAEPSAYYDISISKNYIFGLYSGKTEKQKSESSEIANDIYVFDLEGTIKSKFILNISIRGLTVDEENQKIYGITTDENPGLAVFDLPNLK